MVVVVEIRFTRRFEHQPGKDLGVALDLAEGKQSVGRGIWAGLK
jgi:hypothetical protein